MNVSIKDPAGRPVRLLTRRQPEGKAKQVRRGLRSAAEKAYGKRWHDLWLEGFRVGVI